MTKILLFLAGIIIGAKYSDVLKSRIWNPLKAYLDKLNKKASDTTNTDTK